MVHNPDASCRFTIQDTIVYPDRLSIDEKDAFQIIYLKKGRLYFRSEKGGRVLTEGNAALVPPSMASSMAIATEIHCIKILFNYSFLEELKEKHREKELLDCYPYNDELLFYPLDKIEPEFLNRILAELIRECSKEKTEDRVMIRLLFLELLVLFYRSGHPGLKLMPETITDPIDRIIEMIRKNYSTVFEFDSIVSRSGLNASYFCRAFRERTGKSLFEFINIVRIEKACLLLKKTDRSIIDIAFDVGYQNLSFFNRYFRKIMKQSPREYRQHIQR